MYLEHFGLGEPPFRITPHTEFFFSGANRGATLEALLYAIVHDEGIIKISGEVGSGKTMLCRVLMERLPRQVAIVYLSNPSLSREDILYALADELSLTLPENARASVVLKALQTHLISLYAEGRRVVVLIDEAHAMPVETLEEVRLLSNLESNRNKLLQLVLFGQPELNEVLARADMRQLKERITHNFALEPLVRDDVAEYLEFRMRAAGYKGPNVFSPSATKLIFDASKGLTRRINILADKSLLAAFAENTHQITTRQVRAAIRDSDFSAATSVGRRSPKWLRPSVIGAMLIAVGVVTGFLVRPIPAPDVSSAVLVPAKPVVVATAPTPAQTSTPTPTPALTVAVAANQASPSPPAAVAAPPSSVQEPIKPPAPVVAATRPPSASEQALERGKNWLASASDDRWFLQLYAVDADQDDKIDSWLKRMGTSEGSDQLRAYRSDLSGKMRYGIIYGDFQSRNAALVAMKKLPGWVLATRPYPRQVKKLR